MNKKRMPDPKRKLPQMGFIMVYLIMFICPITFAQTVSNKRGFCGNLESIADLNALAGSGISWYYNWGQSAISEVANNLEDRIDYVPMAWGGSYNRNQLRTYLQNHREIKYILGFNEPNFKEQANIGPKAAAALWPEMQSIADEFNLKLVSPALNFSYPGGAVIEDGVEYTDPVQYLDSFFRALPDTARVDYVAIHGYFDNPWAFPWYIGLYDKFNKPVWITEFNQSASGVTETSQQNFMVDALDIFEKEPKVFRYAWFLARSTQANTNLFNTGSSGELTNLGLILANMSSYDTAYYHQTETIIEAEHWIDESGVHLIAVEDSSGILAAHDFDSGDWMDYQVEVRETGKYYAGFRITSVWESSFSIYEGSAKLVTCNIPVTGGLETWETIGAELNLSEGKHTLRIMTHKGGWKLNWWKISQTPVASVSPAEKNEMPEIYPNPVKEKELHINGISGNFMVTVTDLNGVIKDRSSQLGGTSMKLRNCKPGLYFVVIQSSNRCYTRKIVVN